MKTKEEAIALLKNSLAIKKEWYENSTKTLEKLQEELKTTGKIAILG